MKRICSFVICMLVMLQGMGATYAEGMVPAVDGFTQVERRWVDSEDAYGTLYRHDTSGLTLFHLENEAETLSFSIGFATPPQDDGGANHVLEHAVLCGNEKYPVRNLMHHLRNTSLASVINATTNDQTTAYHIQTTNQQDYYNLMDVYLNAVFHPLVLREENIFLQQGMRWEVTADGITPNGIVYNELRQNSLETGTSMLLEVVRALNAALFEESTPVFSSGGEIDALLDLSYEDILATYEAYYRPDNALVFVSGRQDIERTLSLLDDYLQEMPAGEGRALPEYRLRERAQPTGEPQGLDASAKVDIGFGFSGISVQEPRSVYARDAMLMLAIEHLRETWPEVYMVSDETSGYSTFSIIVSGVPGNEAKDVVAGMKQYLVEDMKELIKTDAMHDALDGYEWMVEDISGWAAFSTLKGFANGGDPYAMLEKETDFAYLRKHPADIEKVWQQYIVDTAHKTVVMIPQQARPDTKDRDFSEAEAEHLRKQTEAFQTWVNAPETKEELASLPLLTIGDYELKDLHHPVDTGSREGIRYWRQPGEAGESLMAFAVSQTEEDWLDLSLLSRAVNYDGQAGFSYFFAYDDPAHKGNVLPKFLMHLPGGEEGIEAEVQQAAERLLNPEWITADFVSDFLASDIASVEQYLGNAYSRTLEALYSDLSPADRLRGQTLGLVGNGTETYLAYLREMADESPEEIAVRLRALSLSIADREGMMVYQRGTADTLDRMLSEIVEAFPCSEEERQLSVAPATDATHSALVISSQAESTVHYLQAGVYEDTGWERTGQMDIMARVLQNGYVLPELRNKRGAYGAQVLIDNGYITLGASGVSSIDETYEVLLGAGDYLRNLDMTQEYLDAIIVSAVSLFDQSHGEDGYYALEADMSGNDIDWLIAHRDEMLATTVEDVKAFADFIDAMVRQQRLFAYTNEAGAKTGFDFAETIDLTK